MQRHLPLIVLFVALGFVANYLLASQPFAVVQEKQESEKKSDDKKSESKSADQKTDSKKSETPKQESKKSDDKKSDNKKTDPAKQENKKSDSKASDNKTADAKKTQDDHPVSKMLAEWKTMRENLVKIKQKYDLALVKKERDDARKEFMNLFDKGNEFIEKIRKAATERIKADPKDEPSIRALCGIMINAANNNDDTTAFEIAEALFAANVNVKYFNAAKDSLRLSMFARGVFEEALIRQAEKLDELPRVKLTTDKGDIVVELFENQAPETVGNFISLVQSGFYNGSKFHRVMEGFMAQGGKAAEGKKEVDYTIYCECTKPEARLHFTGSLSMANTGQRDSGSSEFFLTFRRTSNLDRMHTVFGRIVEGMDVLKKITITYKDDPTLRGGRPIEGAKADLIKSATVLRSTKGRKYEPRKVGSDIPAETPPVDVPGKMENKKSGDKKDDGKKKVEGADKKSEDKKVDGDKKTEDKKSVDKKSDSGDKKASDKK